MTEPGDEVTAAVRGRLRASHVDRERVIDTLKAAFVQGMLTKDEFDARVGQTYTSRTYAELAVLTADIGTALTGTRSPRHPIHPAGALDSSQNKVVNAAACVMLAILVLNTAFLAGNAGVFFSAVATIAVALLVAGARMRHSRNQKRSRGQHQP